MTAIRLGVIGAGIMGGRMLAAAHEFATESVELVGVWDPSAEASARMAAFAPTAASVEALIAASDCVYIASPPASHIPLADQVLAAGRAVGSRVRQAGSTGRRKAASPAKSSRISCSSPAAWSGR